MTDKYKLQIIITPEDTVPTAHDYKQLLEYCDRVTSIRKRNKSVSTSYKNTIATLNKYFDEDIRSMEMKYIKNVYDYNTYCIKKNKMIAEYDAHYNKALSDMNNDIKNIQNEYKKISTNSIHTRMYWIIRKIINSEYDCTIKLKHYYNVLNYTTLLSEDKMIYDYINIYAQYKLNTKYIHIGLRFENNNDCTSSYIIVEKQLVLDF